MEVIDFSMNTKNYIHVKDDGLLLCKLYVLKKREYVPRLLIPQYSQKE